MNKSKCNCDLANAKLVSMDKFICIKCGREFTQDLMFNRVIEKIKELIRERKEMFNKDDILYAQYDKGFIHACGEIIVLLKTENTPEVGK